MIKDANDLANWLENADISYCNGNTHNGIDEGEVLGMKVHMSLLKNHKALMKFLEATDYDSWHNQLEKLEENK